MTTYIPSLTLPAVVFETPALSILLPLAGGMAVGLGLVSSRSLLDMQHLYTCGMCNLCFRTDNGRDIPQNQAAAVSSSPMVVRACLDHSVYSHGLCSL